MIDIDYLDRLIKTLRTAQVASFKNSGLEISFVSAAYTPPNEVLGPGLATQDHTIDAPIDETKLPVDLRTDNITDYDKILNWSGSPVQDEVLPGTGETEL